MNLIVVIPAYNEEKTVGEVLRKCRMQNAECRTIVIDDGSTDRTAQVARDAGAIVLQHPINRGLGAAISTGIEGAIRMQNAKCKMQNEPCIVVTLDADGQHDPAEIPRLIDPIVRGHAEVVIGSRFVHNPSQPPSPGLRPPSPAGVEDGSSERRHRRGTIGDSSPRGRGEGEGSRWGRGSYEIPFTRQVANWCGNIATWLLFGIWVTDSQSGFRAFSMAAAEKLHLRTSTMEVSSEIIREIARLKLKRVEVPITARYTAYSLSKGQGFLRGLETLWKLIVLRFFR